jgi:hypothetical protein
MRVLPILAAIAALAGLVDAAHAQQPLTRAQVRAETVEAIRAGDIQLGDSGLTLRELHPGRYSAQQTSAPKTRAQVVAELHDAIRDGDVPVGDTGLTERDLRPKAFPEHPVDQGKTRQQVRDELAEAIRTGDIVASGDSGLTLREQYPRRYGAAPAQGAGRAVAGLGPTLH